MTFQNKTKFQTRDLKRIYTKVSNKVLTNLPKSIIIQVSKSHNSSNWFPREPFQVLAVFLYKDASPFDVAVLFDEALRKGCSQTNHNLEELANHHLKFPWALDMPYLRTINFKRD